MIFHRSMDDSLVHSIPKPCWKDHYRDGLWLYLARYLFDWFPRSEKATCFRAVVYTVMMWVWCDDSHGSICPPTHRRTQGPCRGSLSSNLAFYYLPTLFHEWTKKTQNQKPSPNHLAQNGFLASIYNIIINQRFAVEKPWFDGSDNSLCKTTGFVTKHSTLEQQHNTKQTNKQTSKAKQPIPTRPWRTTSTTTILPI